MINEKKNTYILVFWGFLNKNIADWIAYKQQKFISYGSVGQEVQDEETGRLGVWQGPTFWIINSCIPCLT